VINGVKQPLPVMVILTAAMLVCCCSKPPGPKPRPSPKVNTVPILPCKIIKTYPHDRTAFTQGLVIEDGILYESTGEYGSSTLKKIDLETGEVIDSTPLSSEFFGEGITIMNDRVIQLTWRSGKGFVYDKHTFKRLKEFTYRTEGWGITHDGKRLIISDGTSILHFLNPVTFEYEGVIEVRADGRRVVNLNELEYINGEIYANVWQSPWIVKIDPDTGKVSGWIDARGLLQPEDLTREIDAMNGIAYDKKNDRLFLTGKLWPKLFEVEIGEGH